MLAFFAFEDTFRRERSAVYNAAVRRRRKEAERKALRELEKEKRAREERTVVEDLPTAKHKEENPPDEKKQEPSEEHEGAVPSRPASVRSQDIVEVLPMPPTPPPQKAQAELQEVRLSLRDVNPVRPMVLVLRRLNNIAILTASGLIFAFTYSIAYTCSLTLGNKYGYNALQIGLVLLSYGTGEPAACQRRDTRHADEGRVHAGEHPWWTMV